MKSAPFQEKSNAYIPSSDLYAYCDLLKSQVKSLKQTTYALNTLIKVLLYLGTNH